jgi:hypothetical protein
VDIYDRVSGSWSTTTLGEALYDLAATSVGSYSIFGGGSASSVSSFVDLIDVLGAAKVSGNRLGQARSNLAATSVNDRYALFAGGYDGNQASNFDDIFDSSRGSWSTATLSQARWDLAATSLGNLAFFGGGYDGIL